LNIKKKGKALMNARFKEWLLNDVKEWSSEQRKQAIHSLQTHPEMVEADIKGNLLEWGTLFTFKTGTPLIFYDMDKDAKELCDAYRELLGLKAAAPSA
jgi:hypothetical protein